MADVSEVVVLPCIRHGLAESVAHCDMIGKVCGKSTIKVGILGLQVGGQAAVLHGKVVIFFLIHLLIDDILLGNTERATSAALVNLGSATSRLDASLETSVASSRGSDVCSALGQQP